MRIVNVVGARPNFMKMAPLLREMRRHPDIVTTLVHTGQHYDEAMAGQIFRDLELPAPDISLEVGSGSHAYQTAEVMKRLEGVLKEIQPASRRGGRGRQLDAGGGRDGSQDWGSRSPTSRPGFAALTGRCPKRSIAC